MIGSGEYQISFGGKNLVFNIEFIAEFLHKIRYEPIEVAKKESEQLQHGEESTRQPYQDSKVRFDPLTGVIRYGDETIKFHRGERSNKPKFVLVKELWGLKKHVKNKKIKAEGKSLPPETLAVRLNMIDGAGDFQRNKQKQDQFYGLIKGINRQSRDKNIPMHIERNNGVQLVITER